MCVARVSSVKLKLIFNYGHRTRTLNCLLKFNLHFSSRVARGAKPSLIYELRGAIEEVRRCVVA